MSKNPFQTGKIQTVLGLIEPGELGVTLTHEHLLIDLAEVSDWGLSESGSSKEF